MNKIINEFEYLANIVLDNDDELFTILKAEIEENHYYFVCAKKNKYEVKHVVLNKDYDFDNYNKGKFDIEKMKFKKDRRIRSLINYSFNYEITEEGLITTSNKKGPKFYVYVPFNNHFFGFDDVSESEKNNEFYNYINYLFLYSDIENKYFYRLDSDNLEPLDEVVILDDEISYYLEKNVSNKRFKSKNIKNILKKTDYIKRCKDLCSMMCNNDLIITMIVTDYVSILGEAINKIRPEILDWQGIKKSKKIRFDNIFNLISNKTFILESLLTDPEKEKIIKNLDIDHQVDMIMDCLNNEEILELASKTNNWNAKLSIMKFIHSNK